MKERPILFRGPMVRAILAGTKSQTRRAMKNTHFGMPSDSTVRFTKEGESNPVFVARDACGTETRWRGECPYGQPGDRLIVKETFRIWQDEESLVEGRIADRDDCALLLSQTEYRATSGDAESDGWRPSIFMPLWLSRLTLEITAIRVERLNDISEADALAEGICVNELGELASETLHTYKAVRVAPSILQYADLWNSINGQGSWDENPWVWVIEFKTITP